jgi:superfamily II DNA helicase RecQ
MADIHSILKQFWGYSSFRPLQEDIINSILEGNDTLALMPTGGGKSICYQVPGLTKEGLCLVVSPLIALMKDQVENLRKKNITAFAIYSGMSRHEVINTLKTATNSNCKFLYVSPERLETNLFKEYLPGMDVNLIAVDEAHCISQWGYDFRPPYLRIASLRDELPGVPVLALTASATVDVQNDICDKLTSPLTPFRQRRRGDSLTDRYPKYKIQQVVQYENARNNRAKSTKAEAVLWKFLRNTRTGHKFRRQHPIEEFIVDFVCLEKGLIIEADGEYHNNEEQKKYDEYRTIALEQKRFAVLRFTNEEILADPYKVEKKIKNYIDLPDNERNVAAKSPFSISDGEGMGSRWKVFRQSFERANLSYSVFKVDSKINKLIEILKNVAGSAIVYCKSRRRTKEISDLLAMHGILSEFYHAGLTQEERNRKQEEWISNQRRVIVCTNAFGMGIDKPDVRVVVHADTPDCLENYYQEAGRAGRDGKKSYAVLLYNEKDIEELEGAPLIRFPSIENIKLVYQSIANYLQIPTGSGDGEYFDFDLVDFIKKFKLNSQTAVYSLKTLEQEGWLSFNEQVLLSSTAQFICGKEYLYQFEKDNPQLEPIIKSLLRAYEGIFDYPCSISENQLQRLLKKEKEMVRKELLQLHGYGIIKYQPQKDTPQLLFVRNRIKTEDLSIDTTAFNNRKKKFIGRIKTMNEYIKEETDCRGRFIASYFGDHNVKNCGVCDNCLNQKAIHISKEEFEMINHRIVDSVKNVSIHTKELLHQLNGIKKEKAWKVINFLQAENKIELDKTGRIHLK